jgi:hypothetical protein
MQRCCSTTFLQESAWYPLLEPVLELLPPPAPLGPCMPPMLGVGRVIMMVSGTFAANAGGSVPFCITIPLPKCSTPPSIVNCSSILGRGGLNALQEAPWMQICFGA